MTARKRVSLRDECETLRAEASARLFREAAGGGVPPEPGCSPNAITTAEAYSAIAEAGLSDSFAGQMRNAVAFMVRCQHPDGHWDDGSRDSWDTSSTAWVLWALRRQSDDTVSQAYRRGLAWLKSQKLTSGGMPTSPRESTANTYATSYALRVLRNAACDEAASCSQFLLASQNPDGGWGLYRGDKSEATLTAYVLHGLIDAREPSLAESIARGCSWLLLDQDSSGSWGSWFGEADSSEGTAFALYVLCRAAQCTEEVRFASVAYLANRLQEGSLWQVAEVERLWVAASVLLAASACLGGPQGATR